MGKLAYLTITALIKLNNNILYSMTWLKRKLKELGLCRRGALKRYSPDSLIRAVVQVSFNVYPSAYNFHLQAELKTANSHIGYRAMWQVLQKKYNLQVKRYFHGV